VVSTWRTLIRKRKKVLGAVTLAKLILMIIMLAFIGAGAYVLMYPQQYQMFIHWVESSNSNVPAYQPKQIVVEESKIGINYNQTCEDKFQECKTKVKKDYGFDIDVTEKSYNPNGIDYIIYLTIPYPRTLNVSCIQGQLNTPEEIQCG
jgi:hypothetical protein